MSAFCPVYLYPGRNSEEDNEFFHLLLVKICLKQVEFDILFHCTLEPNPKRRLK
jgi:hypothetical protein